MFCGNLGRRWKVKEWFYLTIKTQPQNNITGLVHTGHCVVVGDRKWNVIGEIRYENMEDSDHIGVNVYFNDPDKTYRI